MSLYWTPETQRLFIVLIVVLLILLLLLMSGALLPRMEFPPIRIA